MFDNAAKFFLSDLTPFQIQHPLQREAVCSSRPADVCSIAMLSGHTGLMDFCRKDSFLQGMRPGLLTDLWLCVVPGHVSCLSH